MLFFTNGGTGTLLINWGTPRMYQSIRVVKNSELPQVRRISGSRFPYSDNPSDPLPRLTRRRDVWSERKSAHLNPIVLRKCHPITVNLLTVRGYQRYPSTLTNFFPEEHSIQTRDISQDIGDVLPPFDTYPKFCWYNNFLHTRQYVKLSYNLQVFQVKPQGVLYLSTCSHQY